MNKIVALIVFLFSFTISFAQSKPDTVVDAKRSVTFDSVYKDVKGVLATMADGLKVTVDHLYSVLVYQQRLNAIIWILVSLLAIIPIRLFAKYYRKEISGEYGDLTKDGVLMVIFAGISVIFIIAIACNIDTIVTGLLNPEYGALKEILKTVHD